MTPEFMLEELRKMLWSKEEWLSDDKKRKNFPGSVETKQRERDVLAATVKHYETWTKKRAESSGQEK